MKLAVFFLLAVTCGMVCAGQGQPDYEVEGGTVPTASVVVGLCMAAFFVFHEFKNGAKLKDCILIAFHGFCLGAFVGLPISCVFGG